MARTQLESREAAVTQLASLQEALSTAKAETEAVRTKLHNAVRKGKTIDAERKKAVGELEQLFIQLAQAQDQLKDFQRSNEELQETEGKMQERIRQLEAAHAQTAAVEEQMKQVQQDSEAQMHQLQQESRAAEQALKQQIAQLEARPLTGAVPDQESSKALQNAKARAEEAESQVTELREEAEIMNEALQVQISTCAPCVLL